MKKQSNLSRLLDYAGTYRILTYLSWVLAAAGALLALVPFGYIWRILREVIEVAPQYENAVHVTQYGWMAVAEQGSPAELLQLGGIFACMVKRQTDSQSWTLAKACAGLDAPPISIRRV